METSGVVLYVTHLIPPQPEFPKVSKKKWKAKNGGGGESECFKGSCKFRDVFLPLFVWALLECFMGNLNLGVSNVRQQFNRCASLSPKLFLPRVLWLEMYRILPFEFEAGAWHAFHVKSATKFCTYEDVWIKWAGTLCQISNYISSIFQL